MNRFTWNPVRTCSNLSTIPPARAPDSRAPPAPHRTAHALKSRALRARAHSPPLLGSRRAAFRIRSQLTSGLNTTNRRSKRLDVQGRREGEPPFPSLREDLGGAVSERELTVRTSRSAFEHVRSSLHRLDMARELVAFGCAELSLSAPALVFSLIIRHGPFDDS